MHRTLVLAVAALLLSLGGLTMVVAQDATPDTNVLGTPCASPVAGTPVSGGTPETGTPVNGTPEIGTPEIGTPQTGTPGLGTPTVETIQGIGTPDTAGTPEPGCLPTPDAGTPLP